nr:MAG TPA: hypothetical protein [Caudoviricetes sp.]DAR22316.1 MAG TPA: hypothetical protein [Caudoviricetes sp.]
MCERLISCYAYLRTLYSFCFVVLKLYILNTYKVYAPCSNHIQNPIANFIYTICFTIKIYSVSAMPN